MLIAPRVQRRLLPRNTVRMVSSAAMSIAVFFAWASHAGAQDLADNPRLVEANAASLQQYGQLPLSFERYSDSEFVARGQGYALDIRGARTMIAAPNPGTSKVTVMEFVRAHQVQPVVDRELPGKVNYMLGNDPRRWRLGVATYGRVTYPDVYPGIDLTYYGNQKELEFDVVLKPGVDVSAVRMRFSGADRPRTDSSGNLLLGDVKLVAPKVVQRGKAVSVAYHLLSDGDVAFEIGAYNRDEPLTIDPTIVYSTQLGGGNQLQWMQLGVFTSQASPMRMISRRSTPHLAVITRTGMASFRR